MPWPRPEMANDAGDAVTLARRIIPCLDVTDGKVVKGVKFKNLRVLDDPVVMARRYDAEGADELVLLDISATVEGRRLFLDVVEAVAETVFIPFAVGGGIRELDDMREAFRRGADKVAMNTAAVARPELVNEAAREFGAQSVVAAIDARRCPGHPLRWEVVTHGGRTPTHRDAVSWAAELAGRGAGEILLTSMDADGTKAGYDVALLNAVTTAAAIPVIASGGAGELEHFRVALQEGGADAVLAASVFHDQVFTVDDVKSWLEQAGLPTRRERLEPPPLQAPWGTAGKDQARDQGGGR